MTFDNRTAFIFVKAGYRVRNLSWKNQTYIEMHNGEIKDQDGNNFPITDIISMDDKYWERILVGSNLEQSQGCGDQSF